MACVVLGCKSHSSRKGNETTISFHRLPENNTIKQMWIDAVSRTKWSWAKSRRICSKHFEDDCFITKDKKWRRLNPSAVPTLHLFLGDDLLVATSMERDNVSMLQQKNQADHVQPGWTKAVHSSMEIDCVPVPQQRNQTDYVQSRPKAVGANTKSVEIIYDDIPATSSLNPKLQQCGQDFPSSETVRRTLLLQRRINDLELVLAKTKEISRRRLLKICSLRQKERRLENKNVDLNLSLIDFLEREKVAKENIMMLDRVKNNIIIERYLAKERGDDTRGFSMEFKKFAVTLHFFSPLAYNLVRDELKGLLPHPKTISKWYRSPNCNPEFATEVLESIKQRFAQNKD